MNCIFSYFNFQINPEIPKYQALVLEKLLAGTDIKYCPLEYKAKDGDMFPDDVINYGVKTLFEQGFENILILDIDCIPLSQESLHYIFDKASKGFLIGNAQRSHYIQNNEHVFIGSSCLCLNKQVFEKLGKPNFCPTTRGDIAEELTYLAEELDMPIEIFEPESFEASPYGATSWALKGNMNHYGIGTTFSDSAGFSKFYHLFESRHNLNVERFVSKCKTIL